MLLSPYRVLDLTQDKALLCGQVLADLGAEVIHIEPPEGASGRRLGPFHDGKSLFCTDKIKPCIKWQFRQCQQCLLGI